ncbi:MAG: 50S ribosome-binding GTPase [Saprospiraceae bacterium]|nr:50S ribosome-binding GTPase [Saprospiraceae bacterium]
MKMSERKFALVGNPNSGKSTLFNFVTLVSGIGFRFSGCSRLEFHRAS